MPPFEVQVPLNLHTFFTKNFNLHRSEAHFAEKYGRRGTLTTYDVLVKDVVQDVVCSVGQSAVVVFPLFKHCNPFTEEDTSPDPLNGNTIHLHLGFHKIVSIVTCFPAMTSLFKENGDVKVWLQHHIVILSEITKMPEFSVFS